MDDVLLTGRPTGNKLLATVVIIGIALGLASANAALTVASILLAYVLVKLLWRPGEPPVLLYAMGFQWVQASILIFFADLQNLTLKELGANSLDAGGEMIGAATWLTLMSLLAIALGIRLAVGPSRKFEAQAAMESLTVQLEVQRLFYASLWAIALSSVLTQFSYMAPGLSEPVRGLVLLRWVVYYLLAYTVITQRRGYQQLTIVLAVELSIGFLGFFSDFRAVLIMTLMAAMAAPNALRGIRFRNIVAIIVLTASLGVIWQSIKSDYRNFLNQGEAGQVILVSRIAQFSELVTLIGDLTPEKLIEGGRDLIYRIQFVNFFGATMGVVPAYIPHENGRLWLEAIEHVLSPRLFNPSKPVINDSDRTAEYSGMAVARGEDGSSIGIGYIAETYIDFGPVVMMIALFIWGLWVGWVYRILTRSARYLPFAYGCAAALITQNAALVEQSNMKMVGSMLIGFLALYLVQKYLAGKLLQLLVAPFEVGVVRRID